MLEIRKGTSVRGYENDFFREFSIQVKRLFDDRGWDGLLIGMPECIADPTLAMDCLLVAKERIMIIDFKNFSGTLQLPTGNAFTNKQWKTEDNIRIKGGSYVNPYKQLSEQRKKFIQQVENKIDHFSGKSMATMVCFQQKMAIEGDIPNQPWTSNFYIKDSRNYIQQIADSIDVADGKDRNFLSKEAKEIFTKTVFKAEQYDPFEKKVLGHTVQAREAGELDKDVLTEIEEFLQKDDQIMLLTGNAKSGKTAHINKIMDSAFELGYEYVPILTYSTRHIQKMLASHPSIENVQSLFSTLYSFTNGILGKKYNKIYPLKKLDEETVDRKELYIIDDSHLLSNSKYEQSNITFGSGYLLNDLLNYLSLENNINRKVLFIGDENKLSYGSYHEYALNSTYVEGLLANRNLLGNVQKVNLRNANSDSAITQLNNVIADKIASNNFNDLLIQSSKEVEIILEKDKVAMIKDVCAHPESTKLLAYTNKQAYDINQWIKQKLLKNGHMIEPNDYILFNESTEGVHLESDSLPSDTQTIRNGDFGKVIGLNTEERIEKKVNIQKHIEKLSFIPVKIQLDDGRVVGLYVFENYINKVKNELTENEEQAYQVILTTLEKEYMKKNPFEQSKEFQEMLLHPESYIKKYANGKTEYRDTKDERKLTKFEHAYRSRLMKELNTPDHEYYWIRNAGKLSYGWAMTVNKAMGHSFETVLFITDQGNNRGRTNKDYFRWLYTGISIGLKKVRLINWQPISTFIRTSFKDTAINLPQKKKETILSIQGGENKIEEELRGFLENRLNGLAKVQEIESKDYLEVVTLSINNEELVLNFYYNKNLDIQAPRLHKGKQEDFQKVAAQFKKVEKVIPEELVPLLTQLEDAANKLNMKLTIEGTHDWQLLVTFAQAKETTDVQIIYDRNYSATQFCYANGSRNIFEKIVKQLKVQYALE